MTILQRTLGYTPGIQRLVWPSGTNVPVTAYLWGGGGGGGGRGPNESDFSILNWGGSGSGGGFTEVNFLVSAGDVIDVAVGGGGSGGGSSTGTGAGDGGGTRSQFNTPNGGVAGASFVSEILFDTRTAVTSPPVVPSTNSAYVSFLNTHGVWGNPVTARDFDRSYVVNFPTTAIYTFTASADNSAKIYVDGSFIGDVLGFKSTYALSVSVFAGNHTIRIIAVNTGGPGSVALTIEGGVSYSGGNGGAGAGQLFGFDGSITGGGGGGGATVIFKNNIPLAVAAGGGGGGGGFNGLGGDAPGNQGQAAVGVSAGQDGQRRTTDGGSGGGGGGGLGGGQGGLIGSGRSPGGAGSVGLSSSPFENPNGRTPGGTRNPYYAGRIASGGNGSFFFSAGDAGVAGAAVFLFNIPGIFVHTQQFFEPVKNIWVRANNAWQPVQVIYIKRDGVWVPTLNSFAPNFVLINSNIGVASRPIDPEPMPPNPGPDPSGGGGDWGGWSPAGDVNSWAGSSLGDFGQDSFA